MRGNGDFGIIANYIYILYIKFPFIHGLPIKYLLFLNTVGIHEIRTPQQPKVYFKFIYHK